MPWQTYFGSQRGPGKCAILSSKLAMGWDEHSLSQERNAVPSQPCSEVASGLRDINKAGGVVPLGLPHRSDGSARSKQAWRVGAAQSVCRECTEESDLPGPEEEKVPCKTGDSRNSGQHQEQSSEWDGMESTGKALVGDTIK